VARLRAAFVIALVAAAALTLIGCGESGLPSPAPTHGVPDGFVFVRDEAGFFPPDERRQAEEQLRDIATRSGVYGVVVALPGEPDRPAVIRPIFEEVVGAGGHLLLTFCTPEACDLTTASAVSDGLRDRVEGVAPAPEPALGNPDASARGSLRRWLEFVGTVASGIKPEQ
jgi:hypothetical protein